MSATSRMSTASRAAWSRGGKQPQLGEAEVKTDFGNEAQIKKGCWHHFSNCIGGMWATRQMNKNADREVYVRTTLRELVIYIIFLIILCILTFSMVSQTMYYYTKVLSDLFLDAPFPDTKNNFKGSTQVMDFWRFTESVLLDGLYWEYWYDTEKTPTNKNDNKVLYESNVMGVPRYKQKRVRNDSCTVPVEFQNAIHACFGAYSSSAEDTAPFGNGQNGTAWRYQSSTELQDISVWGKLSTYLGGGYVQEFSTAKNETVATLANLRKNLWIDRGTRAVFLDFTLYNANINLFCVIKLLFEFPPTGGMITSSSFLTVNLLRYVTPSDYFVLACECIFIFFIFYYMVEESLEIKQLRMKYFKSLWNILDLIVILLSLLCIGFSAYCSLTVSGKLEELLAEPNSFANFETLGYWQIQYNSAVAICVFFAVFKLFKYISFNKTMTQLSSTISRCSKDLAGFAIMFFIVFFAFAQLGYLLFGTQVQDFNSFTNAGFTLLRTILGDFNFHDIEEANRVLGPLFFLSYVFFVFFVLLNMFLAIINDTYSEVKAEIANQRNEFEIGDYFKSTYNNVLGKLGRRDKIIDIQNALRLSDANNDGRISFDEIRKELKKSNFSDLEIEMMFAKYDINFDRYLDVDEVNLFLKDLDNSSGAIENEHNPMGMKPASGKDRSEDETRPVSAASTGHGANLTPSFEEFNFITRRVDRLEHSIGSIVSKIDAVLVKLDTMEKSKEKKRETMSLILDPDLDPEECK